MFELAAGSGIGSLGRFSLAGESSGAGSFARLGGELGSAMEEVAGAESLATDSGATDSGVTASGATGSLGAGWPGMGSLVIKTMHGISRKRIAGFPVK
jgi:hypothetical protein